ncbi:hypothetical protein K469DRAFT_769162 [Zopfia rhizophila CBS 207.26]|uniref:Uncharacterized protein n=1 Tax=Zopfia rhizophila CBS 207.26 TaxID=1314779 RepID=A0A6A6EEZ0_9PEZI|nr:hypothetical protein K469DRAFT_769162 [Zopfia rhizophila CBS 207.26]
MPIQMSSYELDNIKEPGQAAIATSANSESGNTRLQDEAVIAKFGKKQQLKSLSSVGLTCGLMLTWEVILFTLQFGLTNGGPTGLIYGFMAAWTGAMLQALVMAEMASIYALIPLAEAFVAEVCYTCASLIQGTIILTHSNDKPKLWHATLLFYAIVLFGLFISTYLGCLLPRIEAPMLIPIWFSTLFNGLVGIAMMIAVIVITAVNVFSVSSVLARASRTLWAFSRENVNPKTRLPINAIIVTISVNILLALISVGSTAAFATFYSVVLAAYYSSFLLSASVMLHKRLTTPTSEIPWGPFSLKKLGIPITIVDMGYTATALFFSFRPQTAEVIPASMNYSSLHFGAALIFSMGFWLLSGRKVHVGPIWEFEGRFH